MAKSKKEDLPHHVKERIRHQNRQKLLEKVANYIPKPSTTKRETKTNKLRRVVLYLKYLIHKNEELNKTKLVAPKRTTTSTKCQDISAEPIITFPLLPSKPNSKSKRAHIVFLTKSSDASANKQKDNETLTHQKCCGNTENGLELQTHKKTVNGIDHSRSKDALLSETGLELYHEKPFKSATDATDRYVPNGIIGNLCDYDTDLWNEDCSAICKSSTERKPCKPGSNYMLRDKIFNYCIDRKENNMSELERNQSDVNQYVQQFSEDLKKMHKCNSPDKSLFQSCGLKRSCNSNEETHFTNSHKKLSFDTEYSLHKVERSQSFSQNSNKVSLGELDSFVNFNNLKMPHSSNNYSTPEMDEHFFADIKINKQSKYRFFSESSSELSSDFFSSGESNTLKYLPNFERPYVYSCSARPENGHSNYCDVKVDKCQLSKHPTFSQSSDNFSSDIISSGESGRVISSNENVLSENEHIGPSDILHRGSNTSPELYSSARPENGHSNYCDVKVDKCQLSKHPSFSQSSDNFSSDIISSGESGRVISSNENVLSENEHTGPSDILHRGSNTSPELYSSARPENGHSNYCDVKVYKCQLSKHPSFSQSSDNFSSDIISSGESGTVISSNENVLSENEHIGPSDILHRGSNTSPDTFLRRESVMDEDSFDYSLTPPKKNCDIVTSPDIFCDIDQDVRCASSDFSVDNILSKSCNKNPPLFPPTSERYMDHHLHEPNYNSPFSHNTAYSNVADNRFINYFGMNNYAPNPPFHALPPFSQIRNYPTMNIGSLAKYSNIGPSSEIYAMNTYCPDYALDFNQSMYVYEDRRNNLHVPIKQKDAESFLPPEELSYSLNNFTDSGNCFSQRHFNTH